MSKKVALLDICIPDYFTGYSGPVLSVPVSGLVTFADIADAIDEELNGDWGYINPDDLPEIWAMWDEYLAELRQTPDAIFCELEELDEDIMEYSCYAYFAVINPVTINGITFLNP